MSAAAIYASGLMMSRKRIIQQLTDLNAFEPNSATPVQLKSAFDREVMKSLLKKGVVVAPDPARYYLDREAERAVKAGHKQLGRVLAVLAVAVLVVSAIYLILSR